MKRKTLLAIISILFAVAFFTSTLYALVTTSVAITNTGQIVLPSGYSGYYNVTATSLSASAIQAAVNNVEANGAYPSPGCGNVFLPAGRATWTANDVVNVAGGVNIFGYSLAGCSSHPTYSNYTASTFIYKNAIPMGRFICVSGTNNKTTRIAGIEFGNAIGGNVTTGDDSGNAAMVELELCFNARVDHCSFVNASGIAVLLTNTANPSFRTSAVVDHCVVNNRYKLGNSNFVWGYGFYVQGYYNTEKLVNNWDSNVAHFAGQVNSMPANCPVMYVEDCHISYTRHATDAIQYAWVVTRYCLIDNPAPANYYMIEVHGTSAGSYLSARGWEAYNNTILDKLGVNCYNAICCGLRGGSAIIFNNNFTCDYNAPWNYFAYLDDSEDPTWTVPQAAVNGTYIWNNSVTNATLIGSIDSHFTQNVNYFLRAPTPSQDGFSYTPYTYPYPLTSTAFP
jgi:hypothetical protein